MSTTAEKIKAQADAFNSKTQPWHRHLVGPSELKYLFACEEENKQLKQRIRAICKKANS